MLYTKQLFLASNQGIPGWSDSAVMSGATRSPVSVACLAQLEKLRWGFKNLGNLSVTNSLSLQQNGWTWESASLEGKQSSNPLFGRVYALWRDDLCWLMVSGHPMWNGLAEEFILYWRLQVAAAVVVLVVVVVVAIVVVVVMDLQTLFCNGACKMLKCSAHDLQTNL